MSDYRAELVWTRGDQDFLDQRYSRRHRLSFDGGAEITASSSPLSVPLPMSDASAVDPEEMLVAAISSCHMLWFLHLAAKRHWRVDEYRDQAVGSMGRNAHGKPYISRIVLRPQVVFCNARRQPTVAEIDLLHELAHAECYIANSVRAEVVCEAVR